MCDEQPLRPCRALAAGLPEVQALLQQGADILRLLIHGWLRRNHAAVLLVHRSILNNLHTRCGQLKITMRVTRHL